jgi:hypothetical protein
MMHGMQKSDLFITAGTLRKTPNSVCSHAESAAFLCRQCASHGSLQLAGDLHGRPADITRPQSCRLATARSEDGSTVRAELRVRDQTASMQFL